MGASGGRFGWTWWLVILAAGCGPALDAELISIHEVAPERLDLGASLQIRGEGFLTDRGCVVQFQGTTARPGQRRKAVSARFSVRAESAELIRVVMDRERIRALAGRGTFRGDVEVRFLAEDGMGSIVGGLRNVTLDLGSGVETATLAQQIRQSHQGAKLLGELGLSVMEPGSDGEGLLVREVEDGTATALAGLQKGDRIVQARGVRVRGIEDLAVSEHDPALLLHILRGDSVVERAVRIPLAGRGASLEPIGVIVLSLWLVVLLLFAPSARFFASWVEACLTGALSGIREFSQTPHQ